MINFKIWLKAMRVPFSTATVVPVTLGAIIAWHNTGGFAWGHFWLTLIGAVLIHIATNMTNDYYDHISGCDEANMNYTQFNGGSRVIQDGLMHPKKVLTVALCFFFIGSCIGLYLNYLSKGNIILILGIIGVFLGFFYTAKPIRIGYGNFGELAVGVGFGPLMVMGSYYVQAQALPFSVFLISIPIGILIAMVLYINEFPDYSADKTVGKRTLVVTLGKKKAVVFYHILMVLAYLFVFLLVTFKYVPWFCLIVFLSLPLAVKAFKVSKDNFNNIYELLSANASTIGLHSIFGILFCMGFMLDRVFLI